MLRPYQQFKIIMTNFFYDDQFYSEISDLIDDITFNESEVNDFPDDWQIKCFESKLEPLVILSKHWVSELIYNTEEERFPEEAEQTEKSLAMALDTIDFTKANELMPKLYYPTKHFFFVTKQDLLDAIA